MSMVKKRRRKKDIECLTPDEELMLVRYYCRKIMEIAVVFECPTNVKVSNGLFVHYQGLFYLIFLSSPGTYRQRHQHFSAASSHGLPQ